MWQYLALVDIAHVTVCNSPGSTEQKWTSRRVVRGSINEGVLDRSTDGIKLVIEKYYLI